MKINRSGSQEQNNKQNQNIKYTMKSNGVISKSNEREKHS